MLEKGGGCCAPVGGVCLPVAGVDIKRSASMLLQGDIVKAITLRLNRFQADTQRREDTRMDTDTLQSELTWISGYNGERDT